MTVTMSHIARDLDLSVVTVSKVLRNQGKISARTRKRVLRRAKQLGYQMNWVARSLVTRRTYTIGLLLPDFTHPFFAEIARAVALTVRAHGYHVIISYSEEDPELEASELDFLMARQVDGLIVASAQVPRCRNMFRKIESRDVPYVLIDRPIVGVKASFVGVDNRAIGRIATEHLISRNCYRIAHLRGPEMGIATERLDGYREALARRRLPMRRGYILVGGHDDETGYAGMQRLLRLRPMPDGVFCYNDRVAIGAIKAALEQRLSVPRDIAVAGAGNVHYSDALAVPLTTVDQGTCQIGTQAAELLIAQIANKGSRKRTTILIPPKLVVRESTRR
jgi:LacI family transcriptional regulator, galactose operon repressor